MLHLGLVVFAFTRVARDFEDPGRVRWLRAAAVGLGVFVVPALPLRDRVVRDAVGPVWSHAAGTEAPPRLSTDRCDIPALTAVPLGGWPLRPLAAPRGLR